MKPSGEVSLTLRNGTVDFLLYPQGTGDRGIEVRVQNGTVWLNQAGMAELYGIVRNAITKHIQNIYESGEQDKNSTCSKMEQVADNGKTYQYLFYSLDMIIAVGYRVNSEKAMQFRQWATRVLSAFTRQGYVLDKQRLINGQIFDDDYFDHLIEEIQEIRASERRFYLCSDEPDMPEIEHPQKRRTLSGRVRAPEEPRVWDVGVRISNVIRRCREGGVSYRYDDNAEPGSHASPRPHVRSAHWHTYWTGPRQAKFPERKPIVKWIPPIPIGMDWKRELPTTVKPIVS